MKSKTAAPLTGLHALLSNAPFREDHSGVVEAPRERVWDALHRLRWVDLTVGRPLLTLRGLGGSIVRDRMLDTFAQRAGAVVVEEPPAESWSVMVGRPWAAVPRHAPVETVEDVRRFAEPGWLRYGMAWRLHDLGGGRTLVETSTLCDPTDAGARRAFAAYWTLIRLGSGAMRLDMLATLRRLAGER